MWVPAEAAHGTSLYSAYHIYLSVKTLHMYPKWRICFWDTGHTKVAVFVLHVYPHQPIAICVVLNLGPSSCHCLGGLLHPVMLCPLPFSLAARAKINVYCNCQAFLDRPRNILNIKHCIYYSLTHSQIRNHFHSQRLKNYKLFLLKHYFNSLFSWFI